MNHREPGQAGRTMVLVSRMMAPSRAASRLSWRSRMANTRSMPMLMPTAGTFLPLNMPTRPSYLQTQTAHNPQRVFLCLILQRVYLPGFLVVHFQEYLGFFSSGHFVEQFVQTKCGEVLKAPEA